MNKLLDYKTTRTPELRKIFPALRKYYITLTDGKKSFVEIKVMEKKDFKDWICTIAVGKRITNRVSVLPNKKEYFLHYRNHFA